jgi:D-alanyl-D-alanine carboxypeptidase
MHARSGCDVVGRAAVSIGKGTTLLLVLAAVAGTGCPSKASPAPVADVSATLEPFRAEGGMPGMAAAVFHGGTLVAEGATGVRKLGDATAITPGDEWHLGSDTKAMTATLIGIYVDQGKLQFSDTLGKLFAGETIDPGLANVTLEQLLQHRGGLPANFPPTLTREMWNAGKSPTERQTVVKELLALPPAQAPGTFVYSNAGYVVAAAALERVAGDSWEHLIGTKLWDPLGMASCGFGPPGTAGEVTQPWGHQARPGGGLTPMGPGNPASDNPPALGPAGTVHCTLRDWGKFLALQLAGARGEATTVVRTATLQHLQTPPSGADYADGWGVVTRPWAGGTALTHTGSNTFFFATVWLAPAKNVALIVATNCATPAAAKAVDAAFGPLIQQYAH